MKNRNVLALPFFLTIFAAWTTHAQGTAFTYLGHLSDSGTPAVGLYDFQFSLFGSETGGSPLSGGLDTNAVPVTNGVFTVLLNFGSAVFDGQPRWLEMQVKTNGSSSAYILLTPRQQITPTPYAIHASTAGNLSGSPTLAGTITFNPAAGAPFEVRSASKVANLNADLLDGFDASAFWKLGGNSGINPNTHTLGTSDNQPLQIRAGGGVGIGTSSPAVALHVVGNQFIDSSGTAPTSRHFTLKNSGRSQIAFESYPGNWTPALQIQNTDNSRMLWLSPLESASEANARFRVSGTGLDFYVGQCPACTGRPVMTINDNGFIGIGTTMPLATLDTAGTAVIRGSSPSTYGELSIVGTDGRTGVQVIGTGTLGGGQISVQNSNNAPAVIIQGDGRGQGDGWIGLYSSTGRTIELDADPLGRGNGWIGLYGNNNRTIELDADGRGRTNGWIGLYNSAGDRTIELDADKNGSSRIITQVLQITGGSDLSERFDIVAPTEKLEPGMIVCIDRENPGKLVLSSTPFDRTVAGVLSGAGGVKPGMLMGQAGTKADGNHSVALTGRVYAWVNTSGGLIQPGDLLTTSEIPGQAMKVTDHAKAQGAVIGKAMTRLEQREGLVLVLVSLQ